MSDTEQEYWQLWREKERLERKNAELEAENARLQSELTNYMLGFATANEEIELLEAEIALCHSIIRNGADSPDKLAYVFEIPTSTGEDWDEAVDKLMEGTRCQT